MDMNTIIAAMRDAAAQDDAVNAWCSATYGQVQKVFVGIDPKDPPHGPDIATAGTATDGTGDYPCTVLFPSSKTVGTAQDFLVHQFAATVGIYDDSKADDLDTNVIQYNGVTRIEEVRKLVETAMIAAAAALNLRVTDLQITYAPIELFPYFMADMDFTLNQETEFGDDFFG